MSHVASEVAVGKGQRSQRMAGSPATPAPRRNRKALVPCTICEDVILQTAFVDKAQPSPLSQGTKHWVSAWRL